jgi:hypothetical protein
MTAGQLLRDTTSMELTMWFAYFEAREWRREREDKEREIERRILGE